MKINPNGISTYPRFPLDDYLNSEIKKKIRVKTTSRRTLRNELATKYWIKKKSSGISAFKIPGCNSSWAFLPVTCWAAIRACPVSICWENFLLFLLAENCYFFLSVIEKETSSVTFA